MENPVAAIYVRLSKEDLGSGDKESESIQNQKSLLLNHAVKQNWLVYDIYCDDDYSGAYSGEENQRPAFNQMIEDAKKHKFNIVLCKMQSRFSRNVEVIEQYIHGRFLEWGIRFVSLIDNVDTEIKGNKKSRQINSLINEWYLEDLSANIKTVFMDKMQRGEYLAAFAPYGYVKSKTQKNFLEINPETAPIVKKIFDWHTEGYGEAIISRRLNDMKIPCPRKQQEIDGLRNKKMYAESDMGSWCVSAVGSILTNPVYCGDIVQHRKEKVSYKSKVVKKIPKENQIVVQNVHAPIVSRAQFEEVQNRMARKTRATKIGKPHILAGKVFCHYCGKPMQRNNCYLSNHLGYLRCRDKYAYSAEKKCPVPNIRIKTILQIIDSMMIEKFKNEYVNSLDERKVRGILSASSQKTEDYKQMLEQLQQKKIKISKVQKSLYADKVEGIISTEQFVEYNRDYANQMKAIQEEISFVTEALEKQEKQSLNTEQFHQIISEYFETKDIDRKIIDSLIRRIEFGEKDETDGSYKLKIFWAWE